MVDAIWRVEGGAKTKHPYGIKSIDTRGDADAARRICTNTVRNNWRRWESAGKPGAFLDFLADRYCPPSVDAKGNFNWKRNIKLILNADIK